MSDGDLVPIEPNAEICKILTCLPEKFIVDFANGIDVARDHLRVQRGRQDIFPRLYDGFTGKGARRQAEINASLADGVEASLKWLCELSVELAHSNLAIARVSDRVSALTENVTVLAQYSGDTRSLLEQLAQRLDARSHALEQEVARIDFIQKVRINLDQVFAKWEAGRFGTLSPAGRCYAALEELRWGAFGDYCRSQAQAHERKSFVEQATNRATAQLARDARTDSGERLDMRRIWLAPPSGSEPDGDWQQALAYLADGFDAEAAPIVTSIACRPLELPLTVPRLADASRVARAVVEEVLPGGSDV